MLEQGKYTVSYTEHYYIIRTNHEGGEKSEISREQIDSYKLGKQLRVAMSAPSSPYPNTGAVIIIKTQSYRLRDCNIKLLIITRRWVTVRFTPINWVKSELIKQFPGELIKYFN